MMGFRRWRVDSWEIVKRNLIHIRRNPELLLDVTLSPIMFVLLFRFVFGGAIDVGEQSYVNFLMAGIFVQSIAFAGAWTGYLLANDLTKGMVDRLRSLPMSPSAVITGRTLTDVLRGALAIAVMTVVGVAIGFRPEGSPLAWLAAAGLLLLFGFMLSWVGVAVGAWVRTPEAVSSLIFMTIFPLTFASSAFVPTETMPTWLRVFAENQPMTLVINAVRDMVLGGWGGAHLLPAILWTIGLLAVFFPLALRLYQHRISA